MLELVNVPLRNGAPPINLVGKSGEATVVLGRNLSGKTALCRLIVGLNKLSQGQIRIDNADVSGLDARNRPVAFVVQAFVNYPHWTVRQNIASPIKAQKRPVNEADIGAIAESLGLSPYLDRLPNELSGGQQQRLAIARALASDARVLVLDEPLVNLDFGLRAGVRAELKSLLRQRDMHLVCTTSDPQDVFALADQLVLLKDYEVVQLGAPLDLYQSPASQTAASLMSEPDVNLLRDGRGVRPEHLHLVSPGDNAQQFESIVQDVETNGAETIVHAQVDGSDWVARVEGMHQVAVGQSRPLYALEKDVLSFG